VFHLIKRLPSKQTVLVYKVERRMSGFGLYSECAIRDVGYGISCTPFFLIAPLPILDQSPIYRLSILR
jgi:hypothetical protein